MCVWTFDRTRWADEEEGKKEKKKEKVKSTFLPSMGLRAPPLADTCATQARTRATHQQTRTTSDHWNSKPNDPRFNLQSAITLGAHAY